MRSELPRSTFRPCSWRAVHRYVGVSSVATSVVSMGRPAKVSPTRSAASLPTGAEPLTGRTRLAASAKYTAEPPSSSWTLPNGPSRVSSAIEPTTSSSGRSGTAPRAAARRHHVTRKSQLVEEVLSTGIRVDLHPAPSQLVGGMRVGPCGGDFCELVRQSRRRLVGRGVTPRVVSLDDVDSVAEPDKTLGPKVGTVAIQRLRGLCHSSHPA